MNKENPPRLPADSNLPRPVVLRPEDLAGVAAAGASMTAVPAVMGRILIAGGIPAGLNITQSSLTSMV